MKIKLSDLYKDKKIMYKYDSDDVFRELGFHVENPLKICYKLYLEESFGVSKVTIRAEIEGKLKTACDRCLEGFFYDVKMDSTSTIDTKELEEEIDLDEETKNIFVLSLPMKLLCSEKCAGLCPKCGKNLNREKCNCKLNI